MLIIANELFRHRSAVFRVAADGDDPIVYDVSDDAGAYFVDHMGWASKAKVTEANLASSIRVEGLDINPETVDGSTGKRIFADG